MSHLEHIKEIHSMSAADMMYWHELKMLIESINKNLGFERFVIIDNERDDKIELSLLDKGPK